MMERVNVRLSSKTMQVLRERSRSTGLSMSRIAREIVEQMLASARPELKKDRLSSMLDHRRK
jgi:predicted DNA-binding protein